MNIKKLLVLSLLLAVGIFLKGDSAFAATKTWVGTACTSSSDCDWGTGSNWQGGSAPTNGDDIVFTASTSVDSVTNQDISSLTVNSITTAGYYDVNDSGSAVGNVGISVTNGNTLTLAGPVNHTLASSPPTGYAAQEILYLTGNVTLSDDVTMTNVRLGVTVDGDVITLGGHVLTYTIADTYSGDIINLTPKITGSGTFTVNMPITTMLYINNSNDYSGTTNLNSVDYVDSLNGLTTGFGTSTINLGANARILFGGDGAITINNPINITPPAVTGTFLSNQLEFWGETTTANYTVPHISLLGNARMGVNNVGGVVHVNLAGITTNGHCIQYGDENRDVEYFTNGPAACVVAVGTQKPKVPDTGFGLLMNNPAVTIGGTFAAAGAIIAISRRLKPATKRSRR